MFHPFFSKYFSLMQSPPPPNPMIPNTGMADVLILSYNKEVNGFFCFLLFFTLGFVLVYFYWLICKFTDLSSSSNLLLWPSISQISIWPFCSSSLSTRNLYVFTDCIHLYVFKKYLQYFPKFVSARRLWLNFLSVQIMKQL